MGIRAVTDNEWTAASGRCTSGRDEESKKPSRSEIESLCLLFAVGSQGCRTNELAGRLGLSTHLTDAVVAAIQGPIDAGWVVARDADLELTAEGQAHLNHRLSELGVAVERRRDA